MMTIDADQRRQLEIEAAAGDQAERTWSSQIEPYFLEKRVALFDAFINCETANKELLIDLKMQLNALIGLEEYFKDKMLTGKMAQQTLKEEDSDG